MTRADSTIRFVIQEHRLDDGRHWDLMFEEGEGLATWSLQGSPDSTRPVRAVALPAHRRIYLTYEGPISGDRGSVQIWDRGSCRVSYPRTGVVDLNLDGQRLTGGFRLEETGEMDGGRSVWVFDRHEDV